MHYELENVAILCGFPWSNQDWNVLPSHSMDYGTWTDSNIDGGG